MSWRKYMIDANWNIGFCEQTSGNLIRNKKLNRIQWLKHPYKDRWFADPFILKVTDEEIVVFVEECKLFEYPKGIICELVIDRKTLRLKERYVMLELDTHLSYPAIIHYEGKVYVYPENGNSGKLYIYEYDEEKHKLINPTCILDEAVADATILQTNNGFCIIATKYPKTQEQAFLYESKSLFGPFIQIGEKPCQQSRTCSRPAGNWILWNGNIFRPAQDCSKRYGGALNILVSNFNKNNYDEKVVFHIEPQSVKYSRGIHTINFEEGVCVIDGYGYLYQTIGRFFHVCKIIKAFI